MDIVVIGLGSMGKRRIRLIQRLFPEYTIVGVDERADRRAEAAELFHILCTESITSVVSEKCLSFVCTSPLSHAAIIRSCLNRGWHVFTELNLVRDGYEENIALAREKGLCLFLSSPFLYREEMRHIRAAVGGEKRWDYIYHVGQYLPDWHPWENYKDFFVSDKRTNGCRELLSIELPWLSRSFGPILSAQAVSDRMTELQISYDDNYMIRLSHEGGNKGVLVVDLVSPVAVRKFEAFSENAYLSWEGTPDSISAFDPQTRRLLPVCLSEKPEHSENYSAFIVENAYVNEIRAFFAAVSNGEKPPYGFEEDAQVLAIIDSIGV